MKIPCVFVLLNFLGACVIFFPTIILGYLLTNGKLT
jgi:hypothetical protein